MWGDEPKAAREIGEAWQAANNVIAASGAATILLDNPLQRAARDLPAIRMHPARNLRIATQSYGQAGLRLQSKDLLL
jgi:Acyl-CoA dehydrogenase, C-terminal domain